jgi:pilus assembly protein Flp/PilA
MIKAGAQRQQLPKIARIHPLDAVGQAKRPDVPTNCMGRRAEWNFPEPASISVVKEMAPASGSKLLIINLTGVSFMFECFAMWAQLHTDRRGVTALEYGLIAALIAGVIVTAVALVGTDLTATFTSLAAKV